MSVSRPATKQDLETLEDYFYTKEGKLYAKYSYARRVKEGQEVGCASGNGYLIVMCRYKHYMVHRVIYFLHNKKWPLGVVDHINGNPLDNRPENLRDISQGENTRSFASSHRNSVSKYRGVSPSRTSWMSEIMCRGERIRKSGFLCEKEAALYYNYNAEKFGFHPNAYNKVFEDYCFNTPKVSLEDLV